MWFGYATLVVAFFLSAVAAYYSVLGLTAIFSAAVIPVIIMGGALETGKVVAAMWLHRNWHRAPWTYKVYLLPSLLALMLLTSMGTFGFLSKAHSDQTLVSGDVTSKIALYDEKIKIARENIDANRRSLKQMDEAVDQTMGRSTTESGADKAVQIRRSQTRERTRLLQDIEAEQKKITELNEARAPIAAEVRKVEAEVGPIKYIAALLYGDDPEANLLESAVRWVIILIVIVFDPLAIVLILAGTRHLEWEREVRLKPVVSLPPAELAAPEPETLTPPPPAPIEPAYLKPGTWFRWSPFPEKPLPAYLTRPWRDHVPGIQVGPQTFVAENKPNLPLDRKIPVEPAMPIANVTANDNVKKTLDMASLLILKQQLGDYDFKPKYSQLADGYYSVDGKIMHERTMADNGYQWVLDQVSEGKLSDDSDVSFGEKFPARPTKGQMHVHLGTLPTKLYKFNGNDWIEVDKSLSDRYTHNDAYIKYLVSKLSTSELLEEDLTNSEFDLITELLKNVKPNYNAT